jgi:hypothetical protein
MYLRIDAPDSGRYLAASRHVARKARLTVRIAGAFVAGCGLVMLLVLAPSATAPLRLGDVIVGLAAVVCGGLLALARHSASLSPLAAQPCLFELTDDYIRQTSPLHTGQTAWAAFTRIEEIPGQVLLFTAKRQFFSVPTTDLAGDQLTELRRFIADRCAHPATPA